MGIGAPSLLSASTKIGSRWFASWIPDELESIVLKFSNWSIFLDTPKVNCSICSLMYSRNASLLHRPMQMIIIVATPDRNIVMVPPDRSECRPMSSFVKPRLSGPIISTTARNLGKAWDEFIHVTLPSDDTKEHIFESPVAPGIRKTLLTENAAARTGQRKSSPVLNI